MAVIKDVAKLAEVSTATVSKYLNHPEGLKEEYRLRVEKAIAQLNYRPSVAARSLRSRKTYQLALIVPEIANPYYTEIYNAVRVSAWERGYTVIVYTTEEEISVLKDYLLGMSVRQVDGIIMCFLDEDEIVDEFKSMQTKFPITLISWDTNTQLSSVIIDVFEGIYKATQHLISLGHERIAYIGGLEESRISKEKIAGYRKAMEDAGNKIDPEHVKSGKYRFGTGFHCTKEFMKLSCSPTAIVCANDVQAIGSLTYLYDQGIGVPDKVAVVGFDGISLSAVYQPTVTTVKQPIEEMGSWAVRLLMNEIERPQARKKQVILNTELVIRKSTDANKPIEFDL